MKARINKLAGFGMGSVETHNFVIGQVYEVEHIEPTGTLFISDGEQGWYVDPNDCTIVEEEPINSPVAFYHNQIDVWACGQQDMGGWEGDSIYSIWPTKEQAEASLKRVQERDGIVSPFECVWPIQWMKD